MNRVNKNELRKYLLLSLLFILYLHCYSQTDVVIGKNHEIVYPLTPNETNDFAELLPWEKFFRDATIVGMGEATHGTREFFNMKAKMFKFLATNCGFKVFSIEATYGGTMQVNDYVMYGKGDASNTMKGMEFWTWDTEEVKDLIEWMRNFNLNKPDDEKLKFYGFDCQSLVGPGKDLVDYVKEFDEQNADEFLKKVAMLTDSSSLYYKLGVGKNGRQGLNDLLRIIFFIENWFQEKEQVYVARSGKSKFDKAFYNNQVLKQTVLVREPSKIKLKQNQVRDSCMARNIQWISGFENSKVFVWAHNAHISKDSGYFGIPYIRMGTFLNAFFGRNYRNIGFVFNKGCFQAHEAKKPYGLKEFCVLAYKKNSLTNAMAIPGIDNFFIDLRDTGNPLFTTEQAASSIGALFFNPKLSSEKINAATMFDGLIYINETTRAVPITRKRMN